MSETPDRTGRGFAHFEAIPSEYGGNVSAYESSAAMAPHVWVRVLCPANMNDRSGPIIDAVAHLTLPNAARLRDQLTWLIDHHYQVAAASSGVQQEDRND